MDRGAQITPSILEQSRKSAEGRLHPWWGFSDGLSVPWRFFPRIGNEGQMMEMINYFDRKAGWDLGLCKVFPRDNGRHPLSQVTASWTWIWSPLEQMDLRNPNALAPR